MKLMGSLARWDAVLQEGDVVRGKDPRKELRNNMYYSRLQQIEESHSSGIWLDKDVLQSAAT